MSRVWFTLCAFRSVAMVEMRAMAGGKVAARREGWIEHHGYQHPGKLFLKQCSQAYQFACFGKRALGKKKSQDSLIVLSHLNVD